MESILHRATRGDIVDEPFPHLVVEEALDPDLYAELARQFPSPEAVLDGRTRPSNAYAHFHASQALANPAIPCLWREFMARHTSREFFAEAVALFGDRIRRLNPHLEAAAGKSLEQMETGVRYRDPWRDVALECQLVCCTPVAQRSRSIGPHVDREVALYAGLLYFRLEEDDSTGGDLELYRFKGSRREYGERRSVPEELVEKVKTVPYRRNTLVFFPHSSESVHAVSERSETPFPRLHVNFVAELRTRVFEARDNPG
jgi:2-oxoglutarate-Fe(II)-dependent oxygenase superfamily protein